MHKIFPSPIKWLLLISLTGWGVNTGFPITVVSADDASTTSASLQKQTQITNDSIPMQEEFKTEFLELQSHLDQQQNDYHNLKRQIRKNKNLVRQDEQAYQRALKKFQSEVRAAQKAEGQLWLNQLFAFLLPVTTTSENRALIAKKHKKLATDLYTAKHSRQQQQQQLQQQQKKAQQELKKLQANKKSLNDKITTLNSLIAANQKQLNAEQQALIKQQSQNAQAQIQKLQQENAHLQKQLAATTPTKKKDQPSTPTPSSSSSQSATTAAPNKSKQTTASNQEIMTQAQTPTVSAPDTTNQPTASALENVFNQDLRFPSHLQAEQLAQGLQGDLIPLAPAFIKAEKEFGVNAIALAAMAAVNSDWGQNPDLCGKNNLFNYRDYNYPTLEAAILDMAHILRRDYLNPQGKYFQGGYALTDVSQNFNNNLPGWTAAVKALGLDIGQKSYQN